MLLESRRVLGTQNLVAVVVVLHQDSHGGDDIQSLVLEIEDGLTDFGWDSNIRGDFEVGVVELVVKDSRLLEAGHHGPGPNWKRHSGRHCAWLRRWYVEK